MIAHGAILRIRAKNPLVADQIAINYNKADITPRQRTMLGFCDEGCVSEGAFSWGRRHQGSGRQGFSDDEIWDIGGDRGIFALSNRMANLTAMRPNDEFYKMGRVPKVAAG